MSLPCCCHLIATFGCKKMIFWCICCSVVILLLTYISVLIPNTDFVAENISFIYGDNDCRSPVVAVAVMGMSWVMLLLFGLFCLCSFCLCLSSKMSEEWDLQCILLYSFRHCVDSVTLYQLSLLNFFVLYSKPWFVIIIMCASWLVIQILEYWVILEFIWEIVIAMTHVANDI